MTTSKAPGAALDDVGSFEHRRLGDRRAGY